MNRILKKLLPLFFAGGALLSSGAHAVTCETFAAGDTDYVAKLNLLVAGCSPTSNLVSSLPRAAAGGTVDAITATFSPAITLADQTIVAVVAAGANATTTPTFAPNGLTAHTITARGGSALNAGDIAGAGFVALLEYNLANTRWELLNPSAASSSLTVRDGSTIVNPTSMLIFGSGTVTDSGGGAATVSGLVTNSGGALTSNALVLGAGSGDTKAVAGFTTDGLGELTLGEAGVTPGTLVFKNATSGGVTLTVPTGAILGTVRLPSSSGTKTLATVNGDLGTPSAIDLTNATNVPGGSLTATYVGYGSGSNLVTGTSDLTYATATGTLVATQAVNAAMRMNVWNTSTGTGAFAAHTATNDNNEVMQIIKYGTLWTTTGLLSSGWGAVYNNSNGMLYANTAAADHVWSRGGTAAISEVARLGAGTLSLGVAGTTQGSLALKGSTSGTATITTASAAGTPTLTLPTTTGTFALLGANVFTGMQTLPAGTTAAGTAPLKFTSGSLNTAAEAGAVEFLTDKWYGTITTGPARKEFTLNDAALTSGRVPYVTTNGRLKDEATFTWSGSALAVPGTITASTNTAGGLATSGTSAGNISITASNASTGTSAGTQLSLANSANGLYLSKLSTGYTTNGLLTAGQAYWYNETGTTLNANAASTDFIWSRGGFAATNEVMRLGAGALSLGVNGTTGGSLVLRGSTSGSATLSADAAAGSGTLTFGSSTATFSGSVTDSKGELRILPQNSQSAAYTTVLADSGKHILHPSADTTARTFTIDSNANVAYPIGTMITIVNQNAAGVLTIAITSDTMRLAGPGTTGSRTMAANCVATVLKITSTEWIISGGSCLT